MISYIVIHAIKLDKSYLYHCIKNIIIWNNYYCITCITTIFNILLCELDIIYKFITIIQYTIQN